MSPDFPYRDLVGHPAWAVVDAALGELETNDDVALTTARRYVVGSLVRQLVDHGLTPPVLPVQLASGTARYRWVLQLEVDAAPRATPRRHKVASGA